MKTGKNLLFFVMLIVAALTCVMCFPDRGTGKESDPDAVSAIPSPPEPISSGELNQASQAFVKLAKYASPAVVNINVTKTIHAGARQRGPNPYDDWFFKFFEPYGNPERDFMQRGQGSGFLISTDGYIVTNNHVVAQADKITVVFEDDKRAEAEIVGTDAKTDLALLKINSEDAKRMGAMPVLPFGDSESLEVGEWVIAIGNPFGLDHTVTAGIVSAKGRVIGAGAYDDFIQTDASINPGNSGGPLINTKGQVVGINSMINASGQGIGFAIPSNLARSIIDQLKASGSVTRGWLGVYIQSITPELSEALGLDEPRGALVCQVFEDSPAADAGFKVEDVILTFDSRQIDKNNDLTKVVADTAVGKEVPVEILRGRKSKTLKVVIGQRPDEQTAKPAKQSSDDLGLVIENITPQIAASLKVKPGEGVVVSKVMPGSSAGEAGLRRGDVILSVNRVRISSTDQFNKQTDKADQDKRILLTIQREDGTFFTTVQK